MISVKELKEILAHMDDEGMVDFLNVISDETAEEIEIMRVEISHDAMAAVFVFTEQEIEKVEMETEVIKHQVPPELN